MRSSTRHLLGIFLFLLLIYLQMITALIYFAGVFIQSKEVSINIFHFDQNDEKECCGFYALISNVVSFYFPIVLVAFALLSMLLAAYAKDRTTLRFSLACQAVSIVLFLLGFIVFLFSHLSYLNGNGKTLGFYILVGVPVELLITSLLTATISEKNLPSDWE